MGDEEVEIEMELKGEKGCVRGSNGKNLDRQGKKDSKNEEKIEGDKSG